MDVRTPMAIRIAKDLKDVGIEVDPIAFYKKWERQDFSLRISVPGKETAEEMFMKYMSMIPDLDSINRSICQYFLNILSISNRSLSKIKDARRRIAFLKNQVATLRGKINVVAKRKGGSFLWKFALQSDDISAEPLSAFIQVAGATNLGMKWVKEKSIHLKSTDGLEDVLFLLFSTNTNLMERKYILGWGISDGKAKAIRPTRISVPLENSTLTVPGRDSILYICRDRSSETNDALTDRRPRKRYAYAIEILKKINGSKYHE